MTGARRATVLAALLASAVAPGVGCRRAPPPEEPVRETRAAKPEFSATIDGDLSTTFSGPGSFSCTHDPRVCTVDLLNDSDDGEITLFWTGGRPRPRGYAYAPGAVRDGGDPTAGAQFAPGSTHEGVGAFQVGGGWVSITSSSHLSLAGRFDLSATSPVSPGRVSPAHVRLRGDFHVGCQPSPEQNKTCE